jgi:hypothetical protein
MGAQVVSGSNLVGVLAEVAARYNAVRQPRIDPGACKCHGGTGNCTGCDSSPIMRKFKRVAGLDGQNGLPGAAVTSDIYDGEPGEKGMVYIVVRKADGTEQRYNSIYKLELVDFDVEDENGDGIIEPGEHLFVKRIRVKNTGGMPSPARPIPLTIVRSDWFEPVDSDEGETYLPPSIREGTSVTLEGSIKVKIRERTETEAPATGVSFRARDTLVLNAVMPWINRVIPNFTWSLPVDIRYPLELRNLKNLSTVAQGSKNKLQLEVSPFNLPRARGS